ncbi:hypothetical protein SESBI_27275 [Sesbania bispinosa]|nr:hypothetical protein SESBI_27275 [Sesbania bispinosa]
MANYATAHKTEVNLVVEHVSVAVPNVIEALPGLELVKETQVQKGGNCDGEEVNEGVNKKDKGKVVEVGDGSLEDSGSEYSIDGSWEEYLFDDSEDESMFKSGEGETEYVGNEKIEEVDRTLHTDGIPNTEATPHNGGGTSETDGVPHTQETPHNAGGTSQTDGVTHTEPTPHNDVGTSQAEGVPHTEATPHNKGPSQTDATPQRSRAVRIKSVPPHNPIRSPQKRAEERKLRKKAKKSAKNQPLRRVLPAEVNTERQPDEVEHPTKLKRTHTSNRCGRCLAYGHNTRNYKNPPNATEGDSGPAQPKKKKKSVKRGGTSIIEPTTEGGGSTMTQNAATTDGGGSTVTQNAAKT